MDPTNLSTGAMRAPMPPPSIENLGRGPLPPSDFSERILAAAPAQPTPIDAAPETAPVEKAEPVDSMDGPSMRGAMNQLDRAREVVLEIRQRSREIDAMVNEGQLALDSPEYTAAVKSLNAMMLEAQMVVGDAQIQIEFMSKLVDHGTGGVKTLLQTQA